MRSLSFCILLLLFSPRSIGQEIGHGRAWKKRVVRVISAKNCGNASLRDLAKSIERGVITGSTDAYDDFGEKIDKSNMKVFNPLYDTIRDPKGTSKRGSRYFVSDSIYTYHIAEDWAFYPDIGEITISIKTIAPAYVIYKSDGSRKDLPIFHLKYKDIVYLLRPDKNGRQSAFTYLYWSSLFSDDNITKVPQKNKTSNSVKTSGFAITNIDMGVSNDTTNHFLREAGLGIDTMLSEIIVNEVKENHIPAWVIDDKQRFHTRLTNDDLFQIIKRGRQDTFVTKEFEDGSVVMKIVQRDFKYESIHKYKILENWNFEARTGITNVIFTGVSPIVDIWDHRGPHKFIDIVPGDDQEIGPEVLITTEPMFWMRYSDLLPILNRVENGQESAGDR